MRPKQPAQANAQENVLESVRDSLRHGRREVDPLTDALSDFLEPRLGIGAVNHAPQKAQPLGGVVAVSPDVVLSDLGVQS